MLGVTCVGDQCEGCFGSYGESIDSAAVGLHQCCVPRACLCACRWCPFSSSPAILPSCFSCVSARPLWPASEGRAPRLQRRCETASLAAERDRQAQTRGSKLARAWWATPTRLGRTALVSALPLCSQRRFACWGSQSRLTHRLARAPRADSQTAIPAMRATLALVMIVLTLACAHSDVQAATAKNTAATPAATQAAAAAPAPAQSYYQLLGVTQAEAADAAVLKKAYRKLALQHHPDKATSESEKRAASELFVRLANAYEILSSTRLRMRYELLVSQGILEYDARRDWEAYDVSRGFKPKPKTKAQQEAEFKSDGHGRGAGASASEL